MAASLWAVSRLCRIKWNCLLAGWVTILHPNYLQLQLWIPHWGTPRPVESEC